MNIIIYEYYKIIAIIKNIKFRYDIAVAVIKFVYFFTWVDVG